MKELLLWVDFVIFFLLLGLLVLIFFRILPRTCRFFYLIQYDKEVSGFQYFTDKQFWRWLFSSQGRLDIYQDSKQQKTLYYNNFKLFNILWKLAVVFITFRVLIFFFANDYLYERGYTAILDVKLPSASHQSIFDHQEGAN